MTAFILRGRKKLPPEADPSTEQVYDAGLQLWIDKNSGLPLVSTMRNAPQPTRFGETMMTETREGVDQSEGSTFQMSQFGETIETRTREGVDQPEATVFQASQLGETTLTKTREGIDQTEGAALPAFNAPYYHF